MDDYQWTDDSALWQLLHGNKDTPRTDSAEHYVRSRLAGATQAEINRFQRTGSDTDDADDDDETNPYIDLT
jgi:hypothetical protein